MVKNLCNRIFSMRFLRIFVLLLVCVTISLNMVTPASAIIAVEGEQRYHSPMAGTIEVYSAGRGDYSGKNFVTSLEISRNFPSLSHYGTDYYVQISKSFYNYSQVIEGSDNTYGYYVHNFVKRVEPLTLTNNNYRFDRVINRFKVTDDIGSDNFVGEVVFRFDPFAFNWDSQLLHNLIRFRTFEDHGVANPWNINLSGKLWYVTSDNKLTYYIFNWNLPCGTAGVAFTQGIFTSNYCNHFVSKLGLKTGTPVMFTDLVVTAGMQEYAGGVRARFKDFGYDILTENYVGGTPLFARDAVQWFNTQIQSSINKAEWDKDVGHLVTPDSAALASSSFAEVLLLTAVGVFDAELVPGITLGGILSILLVLGVVFGLIKIFK